MQIIQLSDEDFPSLVEALHNAKPIGKYWKDGQVVLVRANRRFLFVSPGGEAPKKIAVKPARDLADAERMALRLLNREKERGSAVELGEGLPDHHS
jgi:hypothetical protein